MPSLSLEGAATRLPSASAKLQAAVGDLRAAARIARIWPSPHAAFFALDGPRGNVVRLAAHRGDLDASAREADAWALRRLVDALIPDAPDGLCEALRKLGDTDVRKEDLENLFNLLVGAGAKVIRHRRQVDAALIRLLHALPEALRRPRIIAQLEGPGAARLLAAGVRLSLSAADSDGDARKLADRLERARSSQAMFRMLINAIGLHVLSPAPIPGASWFAPIDTTAKIRSAALRFRNCLESRIGWMLGGYAAYYEVIGPEPAVVEILRHPQLGWRLGEALGHANQPLSKALRQRVVDYLQSQAVVIRDQRYDAIAAQLAAAAGW